MDSILFRRATAADKEAVLSLPTGRVGQIDYLAGTYDMYLSHPNVVPVVGEVDGEVILYSVMVILDDGITLFSLGGRVKKSRQGQGAFKRFKDGIKSGMLQWPELKDISIAMQADYLSFFDPVEIKEDDIKPSLIKAMSAFLLPNDEVEISLPLPAAGNEVRPVDEHQMQLFFSTKTVRDYLFPEERLSVNRIQYKPLESNIPCMYQMGTEFFSNLSDSGTAVYRGLVTCASSHRGTADKSWLYRVDVWGNDVGSLDAHLSFHLQRFMKVRQQKRYLIIISDRGPMADHILKFGRESNIPVLEEVKKINYFILLWALNPVPHSKL